MTQADKTVTMQKTAIAEIAPMQLQVDFNQLPLKTIEAGNRDIVVFNTEGSTGNIDKQVVESFGEEWSKFHEFDAEDLNTAGNEYFDILTDEMVNKNTYGIDIGCGTGRWTKCLLDRIGFMEAIDPSKAIFTADKLLGNAPNVRLSMASTENIPFPDKTFDFAMSIGVLHHIPDTQKAMENCVRKVKSGGYFYTYLYYKLDNRGTVSKFLFSIVNGIRKLVSSLPSGVKKVVCDVLAIVLYMPIILVGRLLKSIGLKKLAKALPLSNYQNKSFFIIRNDALDRFGTALEHRFSKSEVIQMMKNCGLHQIVVSDGEPYWHAVGKKA